MWLLFPLTCGCCICWPGHPGENVNTYVYVCTLAYWMLLRMCRDPVCFALAVHAAQNYDIWWWDGGYTVETFLQPDSDARKAKRSSCYIISRCTFLHSLARRSPLHSFSHVRDRILRVRSFASRRLGSDSTSFVFLTFFFFFFRTGFLQLHVCVRETLTLWMPLRQVHMESNPF